MLTTPVFLEYLTERGFGPYIGVPCSFLKPFINYVIDCPKLDYLADLGITAIEVMPGVTSRPGS